MGLLYIYGGKLIPTPVGESLVAHTGTVLVDVYAVVFSSEVEKINQQKGLDEFLRSKKEKS